MIITCSCQCDEGIRIKICKPNQYDKYDTDYAFLTYLNGKFYSEQGRFKDKLRKI